MFILVGQQSSTEYCLLFMTKILRSTIFVILCGSTTLRRNMIVTLQKQKSYEIFTKKLRRPFVPPKRSNSFFRNMFYKCSLLKKCPFFFFDSDETKRSTDD